MDIKVIPTDGFTKELKRISKKHRGILSDIADLSTRLKKDPAQGTYLGQDVYKIRLAISGNKFGEIRRCKSYYMRCTGS
jgi:hypothetical protein